MSAQHKQQEKEAERKGTRSRTAQHEIRYATMWRCYYRTVPIPI